MASEHGGAKKRYEAPRVLRLDAAGEAAGDCVPGSSDVGNCAAGFTPGGACAEGNAASACVTGSAA